MKRSKLKAPTISERISIVESASDAPFSNEMRNNLNICLTNAEKALAIYESTDYGSMTGIKGFTMDLISVIVPNLVAEEIVSVQPIDKQVGVINYIKYIYGSTKGKVQQGDVFASALQQNNTDMYYSSEEVDEEALEFAAGVYTGTLGWLPLIPGTFHVFGVDANGQNFAIVDAQQNSATSIDFVNGGATADPINLTGDQSLEKSTTFKVVNRFTGVEINGATATGEVNYKTGAVNVVLSGVTPLNDDDNKPFAGYRYNQRSVGAGKIGDNTLQVPEIETRIDVIPVTARSRKLKALASFDSLITMQQEYGQDGRKLIELQIAQEIIHEIDGEIMNDLFLQAGQTQKTSWPLQAPVGVAKRDHYETLLFQFNEASNMIFQQTKRARGNFVIVGLTVASVIEMAVNFQPANIASGVVGPHVIGTLGSFKVIKNPYYAPTQYVVGYHGTSTLDAGYVYAPYLPVTTTGATMMDDFVSRQGWVSIYAKKMLNPMLYVRGTITA